MKQELNPKVLIGVLAAGVVIMAAVAFFAFRAPSAKAVDSPTATAAGGTEPKNQSRREMAKEMAKEMRESHMRGREH